LQRRHARYHGFRTRRPRQQQFFCASTTTGQTTSIPPAIRRRLDPTMRSNAMKDGDFSLLGLLAWIWMLVHWPLRGHVVSG
jgi:hypothetical protein